MVTISLHMFFDFKLQHPVEEKLSYGRHSNNTLKPIILGICINYNYMSQKRLKLPIIHSYINNIFNNLLYFSDILLGFKKNLYRGKLPN